VKLIGVRGSGETRADGNGYGKTLDHVVTWLAARGVPAEYVDYQAIDLEWWNPLYYTDRYHRSVNGGVISLLAHVNGFLNTCRGSRVVLAGYSQGAQVVADAYQNDMSPSVRGRIVGIALFGDPRFKGGQGPPVDVGSYDGALNGVAAQVYHRRVWASADYGKVRSYCARHDPVCNYSSIGSAISCGLKNDCAHKHYMDLDLPGTRTPYTTAAGAFLLSRARTVTTGGGGGGGGGSTGGGGGSTGGGGGGAQPSGGGGSVSASNNNGQMAVQLNNFPLGTTYFFCHAGSPSDYPTGGGVPAHGAVNITSSNESWASGLCAGGHNTNMWIGFQGTDGHDYYSNQVVMEGSASPGASVLISNNNGQMAVQVTGFPTGTTYFFCHAGSPSEYPTGGGVPAHGQVNITSPNESWSSGLCSGGHNTNMWIGLQATDGHDYYSNQVVMEGSASPGASVSVFGSNGQMSLQLSNFPQGTNYYFCHQGAPSQYPTGGSIIGHSSLNVTSPNGTYGPLCSGAGNAWIGIQGADGHDYYSNQITL
jgi:hypothetical protein